MTYASSATAVELSIRNELKDYESGNILTVEKARSFESPRSRFRVSVYPGKTVRVTKGNVAHFTLVRSFERHKLKYEVTCPEVENYDESIKATVTLLEIHQNKLPGGCEVVRHGHWSSRAGIKWNQVSH